MLSDVLARIVALEHGIQASDIDVVFVLDRISNPDWIPFRVEDRTNLSLDFHPRLGGRLDPDEVLSVHDSDELAIRHSELRGNALCWNTDFPMPVAWTTQG